MMTASIDRCNNLRSRLVVLMIAVKRPQIRLSTTTLITKLTMRLRHQLMINLAFFLVGITTFGAGKQFYQL